MGLARRFTIKRLIATIFILLVLTVLVFHRFFLIKFAEFLIVEDPLRSADLIEVLGDKIERIKYGIELYQKGYAPKIAFTGGKEDLLLIDLSWPEIAKEYALTQGIPSEAILIADANSTYEEALQIKKIMADHKLNSVIIVSSPYHMRRARLIFKSVLQGEANLIFAPVPLEQSEFKLHSWWTDEESLVNVMQEYVKLPLYYFKYVLFQ